MPLDCRDLHPGTVLAGQCHSGRYGDCHGRSYLVGRIFSLYLVLRILM